jgi:hypothetical protein
LRNVSGLEAAYRDYGSKGVKFFFVYKSLAHPELIGHYVQPFTMDERLAHARQAVQQLGATIPWIVDSMDNRLKHALGDRANSEFIVDPTGKIVRKRAWSDPVAVRKDLEELVGPVDTVTKPEDLGFKVEPAQPESLAKVDIARVSRMGMFPLIVKPTIGQNGKPFYAKLRCEAELSVIDDGNGKLYLGFHLDPFYHVHWNNLTKPLRFELEVPDEIKLSQKNGEAPQVSDESDIHPREFLIEVEKWPEDKAIRLTVIYYACTERDCHEAQQPYVIHRKRDIDGGAAPGAAFRGITTEAMFKLLMNGDKNGDGKLTKSELNSVQRPRFADFDLNSDGILDKDEIQRLADQPATQKEL